MDQHVERPPQRLRVEDRRGDLAERRPALRVADGADEEHEHPRETEREVHDDEEQVAQRHRVALGLAGHLDVVVAAAQAVAREPQRLDRADALDGLGEGRVDPRVGPALGEIAVGGPDEVAPDLHEGQAHEDE